MATYLERVMLTTPAQTLWKQSGGQGSNHWSRQLGPSGYRFPQSGRASEKKAYPLLGHFPVSVWKSIKRVERLLMVMLTAAKAGKNPQCCTWCSRPVQSHHKPGLNHIKFKNKLFYATDAVMYCYMGVHALCKKHSFACRGAINDNWLKKRTYIGHDLKLPYSIENEDLLRACVSKRILDKTIKNSNSQKVESFNRVLQRSLPRNVTFTRSFSGRAHSDVQSSNHGPGNSVQGTCAFPSGGSVDKSLDQLQSSYEMNNQSTDSTEKR